jgi:hypothetical protein
MSQSQQPASTQTNAAMGGSPPNLFEFTDGDVHISYSTSSISGQPLFNYTNGQQQQNFSADEIRTQEGEPGTLVTVSVKKTIDMGYTSLTLVLPKVNLGTSLSQAINALAIEVEHISGPLPATGELDKYQNVYHLHGKASLVFF